MTPDTFFAVCSDPLFQLSRSESRFMKYLIFILKSLRRSVLRSTLTALGTMVLVFVVTLVWSVLVIPAGGDGREEPELQGHRHRAVGDSQPHAVLVCDQFERRSGRRAG